MWKIVDPLFDESILNNTIDIREKIGCGLEGVVLKIHCGAHIFALKRQRVPDQTLPTFLKSEIDFASNVAHKHRDHFMSFYAYRLIHDPTYKIKHSTIPSRLFQYEKENVQKHIQKQNKNKYVLERVYSFHDTIALKKLSQTTIVRGLINIIPIMRKAKYEHGDLHLANLAITDHKIIVLDYQNAKKITSITRQNDYELLPNILCNYPNWPKLRNNRKLVNYKEHATILKRDKCIEKRMKQKFDQLGATIPIHMKNNTDLFMYLVQILDTQAFFDAIAVSPFKVQECSLQMTSIQDWIDFILACQHAEVHQMAQIMDKNKHVKKHKPISQFTH